MTLTVKVMKTIYFFIAGGLIAATSAAAQTYPTKPITVVTPYGAGGQADQAARLLGRMAEQYLGHPLIVVNRPGASGVIGSREVAQAPKDGYTLLLARVGPEAVLPALDSSIPYKWNGFTFIGMVEIDPIVCYVNSKSAYKSFGDLVAAMKANPGKLNFATSGIDVSLVIPILALRDAGLPADAAISVPYKSGGEVAVAVLGQHVDFACASISPSLGSIQSGLLRPLLVSSAKRAPELPDTPTAREVGMPNLELGSGWSALYGPPGLPKEILDRWVAVLAKVKGNDAWAAKVRARGSVPTIMSPEETRKFVEAQYTAFRSLAPDIGVKK